MPMYMVEITNHDGTVNRLYGGYPGAVQAAQDAKGRFPNAAKIDAEPYSTWRNRSKAASPLQVDTMQLPHGGYHFAPGVDDLVPRHSWGVRPASWVGRVVWPVIQVLLIGGAIGGIAAYLQAKGWPL